MAKGSHAKFDGYPKVCAGCGEPVRISSGHLAPLWFETVQGVKRSWHAACRKQAV